MDGGTWVFLQWLNASKSDLQSWPAGSGMVLCGWTRHSAALIFMWRSAMAHGRISAKEKWRALKQTQAPSIIQSHWTCACALTQSK